MTSLVWNWLSFSPLSSSILKGLEKLVNKTDHSKCQELSSTDLSEIGNKGNLIEPFGGTRVGSHVGLLPREKLDT